MISNCPFDSKGQQPIAKLCLMGGIIAVLVAAQVTTPIEGLHKEAALLEKYDSLEDLVSDIRNGKVDFNDFRNSDGISIKVMKDSEIYDELDTSTQECIDLAGKIGNNLGDSEIVHCSEDPNYFKNKYSNSSAPPKTTTSTAANMTETKAVTAVSTPHTTSTSTLTSSDFKSKILIDELVSSGKFTENEAIEFVFVRELVKTEKFTENEAIEFVKKFTQTENQIVSATDNIVKATSNTAGSADSLSTNSGNDSNFQNSNSDPEDYNDLGQLVDDIKNKNINANKISLIDFQNSGAYAGTDEQTQDCIDLAGKIGNNLGDSEIVHCSEDPNYFKNKYS